VSTVRRVTLLVCGDPMRGDDAVAGAILGALPATSRHLADIRDVSGLMPDDLLGAEGPLIILDAVHGPPAGTVVDLPKKGLHSLVVAGGSRSTGDGHATGSRPASWLGWRRGPTARWHRPIRRGDGDAIRHRKPGHPARDSRIGVLHAELDNMPVSCSAWRAAPSRARAGGKELTDETPRPHPRGGHPADRPRRTHPRR
jgi:hypothetical protein